MKNNEPEEKPRRRTRSMAIGAVASIAIAACAPSASHSEAPAVTVVADAPSPMNIQSRNASSVPMPIAPIQRDGVAWKPIFSEDFNETVAPGQGFPGPSDYAKRWGTYGPVFDNAKQSVYANQKTVSVAHGELIIHPHTENGVHMCAEMFPKISGKENSEDPNNGIMAEVYYRTDQIPGYGLVWLLYPSDNQWPSGGEEDFIEGATVGTIGGNAHHANPKGGKEHFDTGVPNGGWHVATTIVRNGIAKFLLDGKQVYESTHEVPTDPLSYSFQCGSANGHLTGPEADMAEGDIEVGWVQLSEPK